ncbi:hypothetical protein TNCT_396461 [Trichonephila clavata]|uniref:Uncharacterized protein n=1 Tax=Trichonephila clavata TaxID=2740835 RepID=A0A8X6G1L6_TRICU|nr:hypothetical protein TNCT_396461 [Trichonephila clavata]
MKPRRKRSRRRDKRKSTSRKRKPSEAEEYTGDSESEEKITTNMRRPTKLRERPRIPSALHSSEETVEKLKGRPSRKKHQKRPHMPHSKRHKKGDLTTDKKRRPRREREKTKKRGRPEAKSLEKGKQPDRKEILNDPKDILSVLISNLVKKLEERGEVKEKRNLRTNRKLEERKI